MSKKFPWMKWTRASKSEMDLEPPVWLNDRSNGEYYHFQTPYEKRLRKFVLNKADENARKVGMDRRDFLASSMGMATTLWCINAASGCSSDSGEGAGRERVVGGSGGMPGGSGGMAGGAGGSYGGGGVGASGGGGAGGQGPLCVPPEAMYDEDVACDILSGDEFIFDAQTHWFSQEDTKRFPQDVLDLFGLLFVGANEDAYIQDLFLNSDTTMAVLTSWPGATCPEDPSNTDPCGLPLSNESMARSRDAINAIACNTQRVIQHVQVLPNDLTGVEKQMEIMTQMYCEYGAAGWKLYPGFSAASIDPRGAHGFFLTDDKARRVIEHGLALGVSKFCVHKGLPIGDFFEKEHNHPRDVGVVAKDYPGADFIIYHAAICSGSDQCLGAPPEGPYDPSEPDPKGVNALVRSLEDNGVLPNQNVYAEVGSALNEIQNDATQAAHFFGKLMRYVGVDNVIWGTDCVIYGSPQQFIEWFRALTIPVELQEQYGYPALDATAKRKIFGLNAARIYGVDPDAIRCQVNSCQTAAIKKHMDGELGPRRWVYRRPGGPGSWREYVEHVRQAAFRGRPG